ncbi:glycosyltransferase family 39 protein [Methanolacinia paynteri]|uniref:glycosyltransferase family 39 protein n=1 Tax=Methanolacinia paynteri TaxID=230356 RepID=UPI00064F247F|nr:glycosyltransferase family 39 protein [Methanolacinia paynteri]
MGKNSKEKTETKKSAKNADILPEDKYAVNSLSDLNVENLKNVILKNRYAQMLIALTVIGFILRFYNLAFNSLWLDEASTLGFAEKSLSGIWESTASGEFNPPLFYYMEHFVIGAGVNEFTLRFIPALLGALTVPVFYLLGREVSGKAGGIVAAALLVFSSFHIYYSQEARAYAPMLFFFSIALISYLYAMRGSGTKWWALFGLFSALAFWMHFYVFIAIGIIIIHALIARREEIRKNASETLKPLIIALGLFIIASLPLIAVTVGLFLKRTASEPTWGLSGLNVITQTILMISGSSILPLVILIILALCGLFAVWRSDRSMFLLLVLSLVLPFIASMLLSARIPMSPRYMIYLLPFYFMAVSGCLLLFPKSIDMKKVAAVFIAVILVINLPALAGYYTSYSKNDWRGFAGALDEITNEGDAIVVLPGYMSQPLGYYYSSDEDGTIEYKADSGDQLEEAISQIGNNTTYYIVTWDITASDPEGGAIQWLNENADYQGQYMGIYLFKTN